MSMTTTLKKMTSSTTGRRSGTMHSGQQGDPGGMIEKRNITVSVVGLSGTEKEKGCMGSGKSCLCNRFVRPGEDDYYTDHISVLSQTDFGGRVVNNDHFLYWGQVTKGSPSIDIFNEMNQEFGMNTMGGPGMMGGPGGGGPGGGGVSPAITRVQTTFHVIEQTEFIDDSSFQPFKSGKTDPYVKRCASLRLSSAEKLMYICKNQLGIEKEYDQKLMPDGRLNVDGFICVFDVSDVPGRSLERVLEYTAAILVQIIKTKKPVVIAATKCDEIDEQLSRELERLLCRKELKSANIPIVETSSHNGVNVDAAFMILAHLVDSRRPGKLKIMSYQEALKYRQEMCEFATEAFYALIRAQVNDYRTLWVTASKRLQGCPEYKRYLEIYGKDKAKRTFTQHTKRLKEQFIDSRVQGYLRVLPDILLDLLPDLNAIKDTDWKLVKEQLRQHPDFEQYFIDRPDESWEELILADDQNEDGLCDEDRVPFQLLDTEDAEQCYLQHRVSLATEDSRNDLRKQFKQLLQETGFVTPGKTLGEVRVLFMGRDCYEQLAEKDIEEIFEEHQRDITERAKKQFQELLLERAELFYDFANIGPGSVITQEDIARITQCLQEDIRYKTLERLDQERMLILLRHLGFVHGPIREHCPANPDGQCMDQLVEKLLEHRAPRPQSWAKSSTWLLNVSDTGEHRLNVVVLATTQLLESFTQYLKTQLCSAVDDAGRCIFELEKGARYALELRPIDGDVSLPENSFRTPDFTPNGCICLYEDHSSLEYVRESLEKTLLSNLEQDEDRLPFHGLPLVMVLVCKQGESQETLDLLQQEGNNRAKALQCPFIPVNYADDTFEAVSVLVSIEKLIEGIHRRAGLLQQMVHGVTPSEHATPDVKVLLCMLCGDVYDVGHLLAPLLSHQCVLVSNPPNTMTLEAYIGPPSTGNPLHQNTTGKSTIIVQVQVTSYHEAHHYRDELLHGFILAYSLDRRASLATMTAFSKNISHVPIQIVSVASTCSTTNHEEAANREALLADGEDIAAALQAHFFCTTPSQPLSTTAYTPFFKDVYQCKGATERAFSPLCDGSCEDELSEYSDEDCEDERGPMGVDPSNMATLPLRGYVVPPPPLRQESYNQIPSAGNDESEGLYEQLPGDSGLSPASEEGGQLYAPLYPNGRNDDSLPKGTTSTPLHHITDSGSGNNSLERRVSAAATGGGVGRAGDPPPYPPPPLPPARNLMSTFVSGRQSAALSQENAYLISRHPPQPPAQFASRNGGAVRNFLLKKSSSLRAAPPPVVVPSRHSLDAGKTLNEDQSPEDDTLSSGLSAYGAAYPPPDPAPPDLLPSVQPSIFRKAETASQESLSLESGWVDNRLYDQHRGGTSTFGHSAHTPDEQWAHHLQQTGNSSELFQKYHGVFGGGAPLSKPKPRHKPVGRLNLQQFDHLSDAIQRINIVGGMPTQPGHGASHNKYQLGALPKMHSAPSAEDHHYAPLIPHGKKSSSRTSRSKEKGDLGGASESESEGEGGEVVSDSGDNNDGPNPHDGGTPDSPNRSKHSRRSRNHHQRSKKAIAVAPPKIPSFDGGLPAFLASSNHATPASIASPGDTVDKGLQDHWHALDSSDNAMLSVGGGVSALIASDLPSRLHQAAINHQKAIPLHQQHFLLRQQFLLSQHYPSDNMLYPPKNRLDGLSCVSGVVDDPLGFDLALDTKNSGEKRRGGKEKKEKSRGKSKKGSKKVIEDFAQSSDNAVPLFVEKCINFIEEEGLDSEGLYRVPGNRAHVDHLLQKFEEDKQVSIRELDIPVNAVATALKDFFSKHLPPLLSASTMNKLTEASAIQDRSCRLLEMRRLLRQLPQANFEILKFVFHHFVRVSENCRLNSMDSKNLAICWWPTLLPLEFNDMLMFERVRPHLEDSVQTMIDQYRFLFCGEEEVVMV